MKTKANATTKAPAKTKAKKTAATALAPKRVRKPKAKVHSLPPGEEAKQMAAGQAASSMLKDKLAKAKAKAAAGVPAGHHVNKNGTGFKDITLEQVETAKKALGITSITKVTKGNDVTPLTQDQLRILARDMPAGSLNLFKHWVDVNGVMGGTTVETLDLFPAPGSTVKKDEGHLTDLKKRGLLSALTEANGVTWVEITCAGDQLQTYLATPQTPPPPVSPILATVIKTGMAKVAQHRAAATLAPKRVPAPKINRMLVRYEAVTFCMAKVKPAEFGKADYAPLMIEIEAKYAPLYAKLKAPDKVRAYSTGIIDFCLAACRKNHLRSNA